MHGFHLIHEILLIREIDKQEYFSEEDENNRGVRTPVGKRVIDRNQWAIFTLLACGMCNSRHLIYTASDTMSRSLAVKI
jgi:hypothetical protein